MARTSDENRRWDERQRRSSRVKNCRSCRAPIVWAEMSSGKRAPFDAAPVDDGEWYFDGPVAYRVVSAAAFDIAVDRFHIHFKTCPDAVAWRGARTVSS